jgi:hypothetical protein
MFNKAAPRIAKFIAIIQLTFVLGWQLQAQASQDTKLSLALMPGQDKWHQDRQVYT